jgi:hypothetical protein
MSADLVIQPDLSEIRRALGLLCKSGEVYELRALGSCRGTVSGYYNNLDMMAEHAALCSDKFAAEGVYLTMNPVRRDLLARSANNPRKYAKHVTTDADIPRRGWLVVDVDPVRPSGISATNQEHELALERIRLISESLVARGWPEPILANSGNGGHALWRIALPNDDASRSLHKRVLEALAMDFSDERVGVDVTMFNAARIVKLYGTPARKGSNLPERPHRLARILEAPNIVEIVSLERLEEIAALLPAPERPTSTGKPNAIRPFDLERWIAEHGIAVRARSTWNGGRRWILEQCLFDPSHRGSSAAIIQASNGAIVYRCHHNSCANRKWHDVRGSLEPGWGERHSNSSVPGQHRSKPSGFRTVEDYLSEVKARATRKTYWQGILREGEISLLVGRAMAGKSTFACALTRALHSGIQLLDRECARVKVGYMALERNGATVARLLGAWELAEVLFLDEIPEMPLTELAEFLEAEITKHALKVVIVDHLQNLVRVGDANDYSAVSKALGPIQKLAKKTGTHLMLLHHQPKTRREGEIDAMGSEAYRATADALIEATAHNGAHFIRAQVRGEADLPKTRLTVNLETGKGESIDACKAEVNEAIASIADYLKMQHEPLTADVIQEAVGLKRAAVRAALKAGGEAGTLNRTGSGKRGDPFLFCCSSYAAGKAGTESENVYNLNENTDLFRSRSFENENRQTPLDASAGNGIDDTPAAPDEEAI